MVPDSTLIAAVLLLAASLYVAVAGTGVYLRFAAILCLALALALLAQPFAPGMGDGVAVVALPLAGASLGLCAAARLLRPLPPLAATVALVAALLGGVAALSGTGLIFALLPLLLGGLLAAVAALNRGAITALLSGLLLMAAACAFAGAGVALPGLVLLSAALAGFAVQRRTLQSNASLAPRAP